MDCEFTCRRAGQAIANIVGNTYTPIRLGAKVANTGGIDGNERPNDGATKKGRNKGMKLRQYQQDSVDNLMDTIQVKGNPILQLPTGAGKSIIIAEIARRMRERWGGIQILVLAHRAKLVEQDADKFAKLGLIPSVYCAELKRKEIGQFTIATILSVAKHPELFQGVHLVIVDECFTGDTLVATPDGQKRIDKLKENDYIISAIGNNRIKKIKKTVHKTVYKIRVRHEDNNRQGQRVYTVRCSGRHPFFTTQGWVRAEQMVRGMELVGIQNMPELWQAVSSGKGARDNIVREKKILLREVLLSESESYEKRADKKEFVKQTQKYWMEAACSLWKRISEPDTREMVKCVEKGRMGCRTANKDRAQSNRWERISDLLQGRFGKCTIKIGNRIRWLFSQCFGEKGARQEKGCFSSKYWVESVEVEEQRRGVALYDLQIEGHPSFFANGLLVHNCQLINNNDEGSYRKFLSQLPLAKVVGLSATPFRLKGGACYGPDRLFNRVAYKIGFADLVKQGYLTPPVNYDANSDDNYDDIKITAGDFNQKDMNAHFNKIVGKSCQDLVQRMRNRNYVLVFACSIVHAEAIVKALRDLGEQAEVYHSEMSLEQDKMTIARFENKEFKYLVSIDKLGVGFDAPFVDGLALMRPTMSRALAIQQLGRGSRLYEGKKDFLVADYAGNIRRHNLLEPDAYDVPYERIAKPKRSGGDAPSKVCKQCQAICATRTTQCACGYKFPPKLAVKADVQQSADVRLPIKIWRATIEESVKHRYVKLLVGAFHDARPVYFFPEDRGYSKSQTLLKWIKLFGGAVPNNCIDMCNRLNAMDGLYTEATFERKGKFFELKKLTKGDENGKSDTVPQLW